MITGENNMSEYSKAKRDIDVSTGDSLRILRELQGMSQNELSAISGIPQSTISAIERDRINLGVERAKQLARALKCHPAVLVFPGWDIERKSAA
jgi:transcriptional regulator with XRE-family HTH domain